MEYKTFEVNSSGAKVFLMESSYRRHFHLILYDFCGIVLFFFLGYFQESGNNSMLGVGHVVTTSIGMCDIDVRPVSSFLFHHRACFPKYFIH